MGLPFISGRSSRGGSFAAGPAAPADTAVTEQDVLDLSPLWWLDPAAAYCFTDDGAGGVEEVSSDGDAVEDWRDKTSNNRDFKVGTIAQMPLWRESGENSQPYVDYTDTSYRLWVDNPGAHSTPMTQYMVIAAVTSVTQNGKKLASGAGAISYGHQSAGSGYDNNIGTTFSSDGDVYWGEQSPTPQSLTTQIIQIEFPGTSLPVMRINGGSALTRTTTASAAEDDWTSSSGQNMFWGVWAGATFLSYDYLAIANVTHDADTVFSYLGDKYDIAVEAVS